VTSQERAAASAADRGIRERSGHGNEKEEQVVEPAGRVANVASPVTEAVGSCPDNEGGDGDDVQNDDEAEPVARRTRKRKREDSSGSGQGCQQGCGSNVASFRKSPLRVHVQSMIDTMRPYLIDMIDDISNLKLWLAFLRPKFEDGNNFEVEVELDDISSAVV